MDVKDLSKLGTHQGGPNLHHNTCRPPTEKGKARVEKRLKRLRARQADYKEMGATPTGDFDSKLCRDFTKKRHAYHFPGSSR